MFYKTNLIYVEVKNLRQRNKVRKLDRHSKLNKTTENLPRDVSSLDYLFHFQFKMKQILI